MCHRRGAGSDVEASLPATARQGVQLEGPLHPKSGCPALLCRTSGLGTVGCDAPGSRVGTLPVKQVGMMACGGGLPPLPPFLPWGDEQPFRSMWRFLGVVQQVLCVGQRGGDARLGGAETKEGGRRACLGGLLWQLIAGSIAASLFLQRVTEEQPGQMRNLPQPSMQPRPSRAMGSALLGSCVTIWHLEPFSSGSSLRVGGQGCFVLLLSFTPCWEMGRQLLFADLFYLKP